MGESSPETWRPVIAALANDDARRVFASLALDVGDDPFAGMAPSRRAHVQQQLVSAGIVTLTDAGPTLRPEVFTELLRQAAVSRPTGIQRFVRDGRILQYPARPSERLELLQWVATQALAQGDVVNESEMNERLAVFVDDIAALRRYLVDAGLVERTATGSEYALPA